MQKKLKKTHEHILASKTILNFPVNFRFIS